MKKSLVAVLAAAAILGGAWRSFDRESKPMYSSLYDRQLQSSMALLEHPPEARTEEEAAVIWNPASVSITSACWASVCIGSGCVISGCLGSACIQSGCAGSACLESGCIGSGCIASGCTSSFCVGSGCIGSACQKEECEGDTEPGDPEDPVEVVQTWWEGVDRLVAGF